MPQLIDKLPNGLNFKSELNKDWYEKDGVIYTNSLSGKTLSVGESEEINLVLVKEVNSANSGTIVNTASIEISNNNKAIEDTNKENDSSSAQVIIGVSTGIIKWAGIVIATIAVLTLIAVIIWKKREIMKRVLFLLVFSICLVSSSSISLGFDVIKDDTKVTYPDGYKKYPIGNYNWPPDKNPPDWVHECSLKADSKGNYVWPSKYTPPTKIKGHDMGLHGDLLDKDGHVVDCHDYEFAEGDNGFKYRCNAKGLQFCDFVWHEVISYKTEITSEGTWGDWVWSEDTSQVKIINQTDKSEIKILSYDNQYNKLGPFNVNCSGKDVGCTIEVTYQNNKTEKCDAINFKWGQDFYIKIPKEALKF